jgi:hypothetical protein
MLLMGKGPMIPKYSTKISNIALIEDSNVQIRM